MLTTDDPAGAGIAGLDYGISTIQSVSQRLWANLALRPARRTGPRRPPHPRRSAHDASSRIAHHLDFAAYELDELVHIGRRMMERSNYYLSAEAEAAFSEYLTHQMGQPRSATARSVRNELDRARLRHAHRLATELDRSWNRDDLTRIEPADVAVRA